MLKKANQKRKLDQMVIAEGEFTTDHLQKLDWRDYLDDSQLADLGVDATSAEHEGPNGIPTQSEAEIRRALAAAEDQEDALAAKNAVAEIELDRNDFGAEDKQAGAGGTTSFTKDGLVQTAGDGQNEVQEEDDPLAGTVDGFMVKWVDEDWDDCFVYL